MKLYLGLNTTLVSGHTVVDPMGGEGKTALDFRNLDSIVDNGECEVINAKVLNHIHGSEIYSVIKHWVSKLAHGGSIILGGSDLLEVSKAVVTGQMSNAESNKLFYGESNSAWGITKGMYEANEIAGILLEQGLVIDKKRIVKIDFIVEAHRV
jgi:hypothetical protein